MRHMAREKPKHRPLLTAVLFLSALGLFALGFSQLVGLVRCEVFARQVESIDEHPSSAELTASWSFAFGDRACRLEAPIRWSDVERSRDIDTRAVFESRARLREDYVARLVLAQSRSDFVDGLAEQMRAVKNERRLDDDRYLELMTRAVQSIPFGSREARMRLPVEVVASGYGVCSEKSLLLAALMLHEDYDTAFWVLESQNHVAPAVAVDGADFRNSGYAFIETTRLAYIGEVSNRDRAAGPVARPPRLIRLGGTKRYGAADQVAYILSELERAEMREGLLRPALAHVAFMPEKWRPTYEAALRERQSARRLVRYLRGQSDDPMAAYAYLTGSATSSTGSEESPSVLESAARWGRSETGRRILP